MRSTDEYRAGRRDGYQEGYAEAWDEARALNDAPVELPQTRLNHPFWNACRWVAVLPSACGAGVAIFYAVFIMLRWFALDNSPLIGFSGKLDAFTRGLIWVAAFAAYFAGGAVFILVARCVAPTHKNSAATVLCGLLIFVAGALTILTIHYREYEAFLLIGSVLLGSVAATVEGHRRAL